VLVRAVALAVVVGAVLAAVLGWQCWRQQRAEEARAGAMAVAKSSVTQLLSYNYLNVDRQAADTERLLTAQFARDYAAMVRTNIAGPAKAQRAAIQTQVVSSAVVSAEPDEVVLLMYVNQQSQAAATPNPVLTGSRVRVTLRRAAGTWLVSELTPV
jgi:Mce-associated membrane protein